MHNSTFALQSTQPHFDSTPRRVYLATSGSDPVETSLTLDWIVNAIQGRCEETGEDIALWLVEEGQSPWIIAAVRLAPSGASAIQWL